MLDEHEGVAAQFGAPESVVDFVPLLFQTR
jgi:hypothetical protein